MANEIRISTSMTATNGNLSLSRKVTVDVDQAVAGGGNPGTIDVGTSEEVISFGDITTEGFVHMRNLDATNFVDWGPESAGSMVVCGTMKAGEPALFRLKPGLTLRMQADTASCKVQVEVIED